MIFFGKLSEIFIFSWNNVHIHKYSSIVPPQSQNLNNKFCRRTLINFALYIDVSTTNGVVSYYLLTLNICQLHYHHITELNYNFPQHISAIECIIILHCTN